MLLQAYITEVQAYILAQGSVSQQSLACRVLKSPFKIHWVNDTTYFMTHTIQADILSQGYIPEVQAEVSGIVYFKKID